MVCAVWWSLSSTQSTRKGASRGLHHLPAHQRCPECAARHPAPQWLPFRTPDFSTSKEKANLQHTFLICFPPLSCNNTASSPPLSLFFVTRREDAATPARQQRSCVGRAFSRSHLQGLAFMLCQIRKLLVCFEEPYNMVQTVDVIVL